MLANTEREKKKIGYLGDRKHRGDTPLGGDEGVDIAGALRVDERVRRDTSETKKLSNVRVPAHASRSNTRW